MDEIIFWDRDVTRDAYWCRQEDRREFQRRLGVTEFGFTLELSEKVYFKTKNLSWKLLELDYEN
jgi:hypothetical protein